MYIKIENFQTEKECFKYLTDNFTILDQYKEDQVHYIQSRKKTDANFASQTEGNIGFHNDGYDCMDIPSHIALYCIEDGYAGGETFYSNFVEALSRISESKKNVLLNKTFFFKTDPAIFHNTPNSGVKSTIINNDELRYSYAYIKRLVECKEFNDAIDSLNDELIKSQEFIKLKAGDLVIIDNQKLVHGRNSFSGNRKFARFWLSC